MQRTGNAGGLPHPNFNNGLNHCLSVRLELARSGLSTSVSLDGHSIAPLLLGARHVAPRKDVYVEMGVSRAIHTKLWTLVVHRPRSTMLRQAAANVHEAMDWARVTRFVPAAAAATAKQLQHSITSSRGSPSNTS